MSKRSILQLLVIILTFNACSTDDDNTTTDNGNTDGGPSTQIVGTAVSTNTDKTLKSVCFANETVGYITGGKAELVTADNSAIILKTTDGGTTWNSVFTDTGYYAISIYATSPTVAYATTSSNFILKTTDGGATWEQKQIGTNNFYMSHVNFVSNDVGYVVGSSSANGQLYKTTDAGETWIDLKEDNTILTNLLIDNQLTNIEFSATETISISGGLWNNGTLLRSTNAGVDWNKISVSGNIKTTDVSIAGNTGFLIGNNGIANASSELGELFKTTDSGVTWSLVNTGFNNRIEKLSYKNDVICVVGKNKSNNLSDPEFLMLSKDNGNTWSRVGHDFAVAGWEDVTFISATKIIAVGYSGRSILIEL